MVQLPGNVNLKEQEPASGQPDPYAHLRGAEPYVPTEVDARAEALARKAKKGA
jgi:hypothetical protein